MGRILVRQEQNFLDYGQIGAKSKLNPTPFVEEHNQKWIVARQ